MGTLEALMPAEFTKDPGDILDYAFDWSQWLSVGETISTSNWTVPAGITMTTSSNTSTQATVWLSGGTAGQIYYVKNQIVTNQNRTVDRTMLIRVEMKGS